MTNRNKITNICLSITTALIVSIWIYIQALIKSNPEFFLKVQDKSIVAIIIAFIFSTGFYSIVFKLISFFLDKCSFIKKIVYWGNYLDGIWVGFFVGKSGKLRLFYEEFSQSIDSFRIKGSSFNEDGSIHATWIVENPLFKNEESKLIYYYETDVINNTSINPGFASFNIYYSKHHLPTRLIGFSSDLYNSKKVMTIEEKVNNADVTNQKEIIELAKEIYARNKSFLIKE